jgi:hypothetical protein
MSDETEAPQLAEYTDERGLTYQLSAADAKLLGYSRVETKVVESAVEVKPPAKRTASTK